MKRLIFLPAILITFALFTGTGNVSAQTPEQTAPITDTNCTQGYDGATPEITVEETGELPKIACGSIKNSALLGACGCVNGTLGDGSQLGNTKFCSQLKSKYGY